MKGKRPKNVKRITKKKNNHYLPLLFFLLGIIATITTVSIVTTQWSEIRSRAASKGWLSGASDIAGEIDGKAQPEKHWTKFEQWRGSPVTIAGTWSDSSAADQENMWAYNNYQSFPENLDLSVGAIYDSETFADAASGKLDTRYKKALANIDKTWNNKKTIFLRYAHEFNGSWYKWSVTKSNVEDYKKAFQHFHSLVQSELVAKGREAKVVWSPNDGSHSDASAEEMYPGNEYVDVIGVDSYDWDPQRTESNWESAANAKESDGSPRGIEAWRQFALTKGKPIAFPEWGCNPDKSTPPVDCPFYIQKMNEYFRANAGTGPGQVWYEIYFNDYDTKTRIFPTTSVPQAAEMYKSLKWGDGGVSTEPTTIVPSNIPLTPSFVCGGSQNCVPSITEPPTNEDTNGDNNSTVDPTETLTEPIQTPDSNKDGNENNDQDNNNDNDNDNGNNHSGKHGHRSGGGLFELLLEFFKLIIEFFTKLFSK